MFTSDIRFSLVNGFAVKSFFIFYFVLYRTVLKYASEMIFKKKILFMTNFLFFLINTLCNIYFFETLKIPIIA